MSVQPGPGSADVSVPDALPVLPLRDAVVFPLTVVPLAVDEPRSIRLIDEVMRGNRLLALVARREAKPEPAVPDDLYRMGTVGMIHQLARVPDGSVRLIVQGLERIRLVDWISQEPYLVARVQAAHDEIVEATELDALRRAVVDVFRRLVEASPELPDEMAAAAANLGDPRQLLYFVATVVPLATAMRQELLELDPLTAKLRRLLDGLQRELAVRELGRKITTDTEERLSKKQREYYLREQLRSIQRELGEEEAGSTEVAELRRRIDEANLPEEARREAERELARLGGISPASPEHGMVVSYLEWLASLPWHKESGGAIDIQRARQVLDEDHFDLDKIKDRILEYLAVKKLRAERGADREQPREPILCFVGPPGVGKTSLGQSIARALGRKFVRMSLGGVRDEAEIRGHRRTYIGALPGRIIQGLRRADTRDPVFMLDELDKIGADWRGDPSSALLEVLDPAQNHTFVDNYLGVPFDLSQVLFIATANALDTIPAALRDRMEVLMLSGYTDEEKIGIALQYLIPKQLAAHGLKADELSFDPDAIRLIVRGYTREAGVRNLEREIAAVARKVARRIAEGRREPVRVTAAAVVEYLGRPRFFDEVAERTERPGVATGGHDDAERRGAPAAHRHARRRHARERPGRRLLRVVQRREPRHRPGDLRGQDHSHPRAGRRHSQGRSLGRGDDHDGAGVAGHPTAGAQRRGDDRRDHAAWQGAAGRRDQGEGAGRPSRRHPLGDPPRSQRARRRGRAGGSPPPAPLHLRRRRRRGPAPCPHTGHRRRAPGGLTPSRAAPVAARSP